MKPLGFRKYAETCRGEQGQDGQHRWQGQAMDQAKPREGDADPVGPWCYVKGFHGFLAQGADSG